MKKNHLSILSGFCLLFASCGNNSETKEVVADTITVLKTDTVAVVMPIDTAAIAAFYAAEHAKNKGANKTAPKVKGTKKVSIDSDPVFNATDLINVGTSASPGKPSETKTDVIVIHDLQMFYFIPDEKASFPGGEKVFDKYLVDNLEYPQAALDANQSRVVYPTLFIDEKGNPIKVEFPGAPTIYGFQDEARRILMASPRWNPAKSGGVPVKSKFTIPINFKIM